MGGGMVRREVYGEPAYKRSGRVRSLSEKLFIIVCVGHIKNDSVTSIATEFSRLAKETQVKNVSIFPFAMMMMVVVVTTTTMVYNNDHYAK